MPLLPGQKEDKHVTIQVFGDVQGVFFRRSTKRKADALGIHGFVRNDPDETVYIEAEGTDEKIQELIKWLENSPEPAKVASVETEFSEKTKGFYGFETR